MKTKIFLITLLINLFFFINISAGQSDKFDSLDGHRGYWLGLGIGGNYFGVTQSGNVTYALNENIFMIRYTKSNEFQFNVDGVYDKPEKNMKELAFMYGKYLKSNNTILSLAAGLSYLKGTNRGANIQYHEFETENISTFGIPIQLDFMLGFTNNVGIGIQLYGNINKDKSFTGVVFKINIGLF